MQDWRVRADDPNDWIPNVLPNVRIPNVLQ
jgi:hypothetical protein